ncbi:MAG TPA: hypothetical protein VK133_00385 [Amoebophilaceae bacterium]|nr:hypothetical protein [Amoebophilaceae bacterium]
MVEDHNRYYEYFQQSYGKGNDAFHPGIGDIYTSLPQFQRGYGIRSRRRLLGSVRPRLGYGWSSWWSNIFQFAKPLLKKGFHEVARPLMSRGLHEVADVAGKVAADTLQGVTLKDALKRRTKEKAGELVEKVPQAFSGLIRKSRGTGLRSRSVHPRSKGSRPNQVSNIVRAKVNKRGKKRKTQLETVYPGLKLLQ